MPHIFSFNSFNHLTALGRRDFHCKKRTPPSCKSTASTAASTIFDDSSISTISHASHHSLRTSSEVVSAHNKEGPIQSNVLGGNCSTEVLNLLNLNNQQEKEFFIEELADSDDEWGQFVEIDSEEFLPSITKMQMQHPLLQTRGNHQVEGFIKKQISRTSMLTKSYHMHSTTQADNLQKKSATRHKPN